MFLTALASMILASAPPEPPKPIAIPLVLHEFTQTELDTNSPLQLVFHDTKPLSIDLKSFHLPADFKPTQQLLVFIESEEATALAENAPDGKTLKKVWVDWNRNQKAEPSEFATPVGTFKRLSTSFYVMKFAGANQSKHGLIHVQVLACGTNMYTMMPTACGEGSLTLEGYKVPLRVIDSNLNGRFESNLAQRGDQLVVPEFDADGRAIQGYPRTMNALFPMPDARYYRIAITTDGKYFEVKRDESPLGSLVFGSTNLASLTVVSGSNTLSPRTVKGVASVPEGSYILQYAAMMRKGPDGHTYMCAYAGNSATPLKVKGGEKTVVDLEGALSLLLKVSANSPPKVFDLTCNLKNGLHVSGIDKMNAKSQADALKAPELTIVDAAGNTIEKLTFEFG